MLIHFKDMEKREVPGIRVGIVCAGDEELAPFLPVINNCKITERALLKFYEGAIQGIEIVALYSGVCKVNAAIASQILIDVFGTNLIINSGTAGGMNPNLELFDTVISTEVCYHDVAPERSKAAVKKIEPAGNVFWGRMVTGESFITDEGRQKINDEYAPFTVDMETASIAHVCYVNGIPFISIRCVTDTDVCRGICNFEENCAKASMIAKNITVALLNEFRG